MVMVALAPPGITPRLPVTTPALWAQVPWELLTDTKFAWAGRMFVTVTAVASDGPVLATVTV